MKAWQGPGRKGRLGRKPRRDMIFHSFPLLAFRKAQRGWEEMGLEAKRTPPPQVRRDRRLRIVSKMTFLPGPWNHLTFYLYQLFGLQLIWR